MFYTGALLYVVAAVFYLLFSSASIQPWNTYWELEQGGDVEKITENNFCQTEKKEVGSTAEIRHNGGFEREEEDDE